MGGGKIAGLTAGGIVVLLLLIALGVYGVYRYRKSKQYERGLRQIKLQGM